MLCMHGSGFIVAKSSLLPWPQLLDLVLTLDERKLNIPAGSTIMV